MSIPRTGRERDEHHHVRVRDHASGAAVSADNVLIAGGFFTINQIYSLLPVNSQQQGIPVAPLIETISDRQHSTGYTLLKNRRQTSSQLQRI